MTKAVAWSKSLLIKRQNSTCRICKCRTCHGSPAQCRFYLPLAARRGVSRGDAAATGDYARSKCCGIEQPGVSREATYLMVGS